MRMPFWIKLSLVIGIGIAIGVWFAGESTRKLHTDYLLDTVRSDMQRTTRLLSGLIVDSVISGESERTRLIIKQYAAGWSEFTYIHVLDEDGFFFTEWQKHPIKFGPHIRKFEQPVEHGGEQFGILSIYVDMKSIDDAITRHVNKSRRQSALILLSITMFITFFVNFTALKNEQGK